MAEPTVGIIDYGLGNLHSVAGAVRRLGHRPTITADPDALGAAAKLILPGVGAFGDGMKNLAARGLVEALDELVRGQGKPILGICLGSQLFARRSFEFGEHGGLGWVDAEVVPIETGSSRLRVPHVGWNDLFQVRESLLFEGVPADALVYYVHSYHVRCADPALVIGETDYGGRLTAAYQQGSIYATQFHPEKSQRHGLSVLRNFLKKA